MESREVGWKAAVALSAIAGAALARSLASNAWESTTGREPPKNPAAPSTDWSEALTWAAILGISTGVARMLARRGAAAAWEAVDGQPPPGIEETGGDRPVRR